MSLHQCKQVEGNQILSYTISGIASVRIPLGICILYPLVHLLVIISIPAKKTIIYFPHVFEILPLDNSAPSSFLPSLPAYTSSKSKSKTIVGKNVNHFISSTLCFLYSLPWNSDIYSVERCNSRTHLLVAQISHESKQDHTLPKRRSIP